MAEFMCRVCITKLGALVFNLKAMEQTFRVYMVYLFETIFPLLTNFFFVTPKSWCLAAAGRFCNTAFLENNIFSFAESYFL